MTRILFKSNYVLHISGKSDLGWPADMHKKWIDYNLALLLLSSQKEISVYSFVLMSNHYHLLLNCKDLEDLNFVIDYLRSKEDADFEIYYKRIEKFSIFLETYKYIYLNPLKAGLCTCPKDYFYSSLYQQIYGKGLNAFKDPFHLIFDEIRVMRWLKGQTKQLYYQTF